MPLFTITVQDDVLNRDTKAKLAAELTDLHSSYAGVPQNWVHVVFSEYASGNGFTAGVPAQAASLTLLIRTGRTPEYKRALIQQLWTLLQTATGAPDDQIVIGIQEVPPSQAMEMGVVMPEVGEG
jgi:phenylpyruvate tautomerase PptA (4-oxalocrotonate tautomerase family)